MKKSRIFMAAGTIVLAFAALFATKANKRFAAINSAEMHGNSGYAIYFENGSSLLQTSATLPVLDQLNMKIRTTGSSKVGAALVTTTNGTVKVYYN
jgi:hypothetical protein